MRQFLKYMVVILPLLSLFLGFVFYFKITQESKLTNEPNITNKVDFSPKTPKINQSITFQGNYNSDKTSRIIMIADVYQISENNQVKLNYPELKKWQFNYKGFYKSGLRKIIVKYVDENGNTTEPDNIFYIFIAEKIGS